MHHPLTAAAIAALACAAPAQTAPAQTVQPARYAIDATLIPANPPEPGTPRGFDPTPVSAAFTYQGFLEDNGAPANAPYDMSFLLIDAAGDVVAGPVCRDNVAVTSGIFSVQLDFGAQFTGQPLRLVIAIRPGGAAGNCNTPAGYIELSPASDITATPYALGLRLPYEASWPVSAGSVLTVTNAAPGGIAAIRGIRGAPITIPFANYLSAVRGDATGQLNIGVLGVTDEGYGLAAYADGDGARGVFALAFGASARAVDAIASGPNGTGILASGGPGGYAAIFNGRSQFNGNVGINTPNPTAALDVVGATRTSALQVTDNAGPGRTLVSDSQGNATWTPTGAGFVAGGTPGVTNAVAFVSPVAVVTVTAGQRVHVTATQSLGSLAAGGGTALDLWVGYRVAGSGAVPTVIGGGIFGMTVPQNQRHTFTLSGIFVNLPAGTYEVGLVGRSGNPATWTNNDWGYVTAFTLN